MQFIYLIAIFFAKSKLGGIIDMNGVSFSVLKTFYKLGSFPDNALRIVIISCIKFYQQFISHRKGYCCAHRVLYGESSCSMYVRRAFEKRNSFSAFRLSLKRFQLCKEASLILNQDGFINGTSLQVCSCAVCGSGCST